MQKVGGHLTKQGPGKSQAHIVLHTIKYSFAKWYGALPFQRFMHCLGRRASEEVAQEVLCNGAKHELIYVHSHLSKGRKKGDSFSSMLYLQK